MCVGISVACIQLGSFKRAYFGGCRAASVLGVAVVSGVERASAEFGKFV